MKKIIKYIDKPLLLVTVILFIFGLIMVFSASNVTAYMTHAVSPYNYFIKQGVFLIVGFFLFLFMMKFNLKSYGLFSKGLLLIAIVSLIALLIYGTAQNQAVSWFDLGPFSIQPSEFIKVITIVFLADYYEKNIKKLNGWGASLFPIGLCALVAGLIFIQPDLGTTIIYALIVGIIFLAVPINREIKYKTVFALVGLIVFGALVLFGAGKGVLLERQMQRFNFSNPCSRILDTGNQVCNCYIAINNGGLTGVGLGNSTQKYLYLPEPYTDFIYAIIVEELGVVTGIILILLYIFILYRILLIGRRSPNNRGAVLCYGIAAYIFFHIAINLLGIMGLMPMTGVPLPFMSYGGSFTICLIAALTIVQRVSVENGILKEKGI
ncbi:MAG: FtsW/RodA/SpoVE family cell cycle protein [Bacilli bacterium]|nr:FtsW/RodA/SpoVE family cell cycle protein [Bacilli bacterium]